MNVFVWLQMAKNDSMKAWKFKVRNNPEEIIKKLDSALGSGDGFVFNTDHDKNESVRFNFRKRVLYPHQILHRNRISVHGKISETVTENDANVEVTFAQHFLITLNIFIFIGLGLFALILGIGGSTSAYILGGISIAVGVVFWIAANNKFEKDLQKYKTLISEILEF